jgi:predicted ferric reductase
MKYLKNKTKKNNIICFMTDVGQKCFTNLYTISINSKYTSRGMFIENLVHMFDRFFEMHAYVQMHTRVMLLVHVPFMFSQPHPCTITRDRITEAAIGRFLPF